MNIVNKFAESLGMRIVKLNIHSMCLFVFGGLENQLLTAEFRSAGLQIVWSEECICIKSDRVFFRLRWKKVLGFYSKVNFVKNTHVSNNVLHDFSLKFASFSRYYVCKKPVFVVTPACDRRQ